MKKKNFIELSEKVVTDDAYTSFVATFESHDMVLASIICAWLRNSNEDVLWVAKKIINERMDGCPTSYILRYKGMESVVGSLYKNISERNYDCLMFALNRIILLQGGIKNTFLNYFTSPRHKCRYAHESLSLMLGNNTCFPNSNNKGTFYRYYLIMYWLVYKFGIWDNIDSDCLLLPCNDMIFECAYKYGITKNIYKSTITNTVKLTDIAKQWFGNRDFWKMYEILTFNEQHNYE